MAYIELEEALERVKYGVYTSKNGHYDDCAGAWMDGVGDAIEQICEILSEIPPVDVVPVVHGRWEYDPNGCDWGIGAWRCSECGCKNDALPWNNKLNPYSFACSHYCPYCGARMDGV